MAGDEKKIAKQIRFMQAKLKNIEEAKTSLQNETDSKKIKKLKKVIENNKAYIVLDGDKLSRLGGNLELLTNESTSEQLEILNEIFTQGLDMNSVSTQRDRNTIIQKWKKWIEKLVELEEKYPPYDKTLPVKEKLKSKIYKQEKNIGYYMLVDSEEGSSAYEESWNYTRDFATTTEFTPEERKIIERCIIVGHEYDEYTSEKYAFINNIRNNILEQKQIKLEGDIKAYITQLATDFFPTIIKEFCDVSSWNEEEIHREARRMAREFMHLASDEEQRAQLLADRDKVKEEQYDTLKKDMGIVGKVMLRGENSENVMMLSMINELGVERGIYAVLYSGQVDTGTDPELYKKILDRYSFEDLGISD